MSTDCRICCRPLHAPFRVYDAAGHVVNGCVCSDHDGHLVTPSASAAWHARPEAKAIRRRETFRKLGAVA